MNLSHTKSNEIIVFKPQNGQTEFQVILDGENDTVWVTEQQQMELFNKARRTIGEHIKNIYCFSCYSQVTCRVCWHRTCISPSSTKPR